MSRQSPKCDVYRERAIFPGKEPSSARNVVELGRTAGPWRAMHGAVARRQRPVLPPAGPESSPHDCAEGAVRRMRTGRGRKPPSGSWPGASGSADVLSEGAYPIGLYTVWYFLPGFFFLRSNDLA